MSLEQRVMKELKEAMKSKDKARMRGLRAIKAEILMAKTEGRNKELSETREMQILQRLIKQRKDSLEIFEKENRKDLATKEREEIEVIEKFLPEQLSEEELEAKIQEIIDETGAESMKDMGKVMGIATKRLAGKSDNKTISQVVRNLLG
jgi:uncharacterized protein YqeY